MSTKKFLSQLLRKRNLFIMLVFLAIVGLVVVSCTTRQENKEGKRQSAETEVAEAEVKDGLGEAQQEEQIKRSTSANEVTVTTDKREYRQGEAIKITITNDLGESIFSNIGSGTPIFCIEYIERKITKGNWEKLLVQGQYPYVLSDKPRDVPKEIKPGQSQTFVWLPFIFFKAATEPVQVSPGQYRFSISYYEDKDGEQKKSIYTKEFRIR